MNEKINILKELKEVNAATLMGADNRNYYSVPEGYFNELPGNVLTYVFVKSLPATNPYTIPEGYFENLPAIILDKINVASFGFNDKNVFSVPDGYFNSLADNILKKIKEPVFKSAQQELNEISPLLSRIPKTNVYSVPENYFGELDPLAATGNVKQETKIISIGSTRRKWLNYAAAACIAAFAFTGGYFYFSNSKTKNPSAPSLSQINVQKEISVLSDDEISNYLKDNNNIAVYTNIGDDDQQQQSNMDVQDLLQNVSDEEIQQYLNQDATSGGGI
jgi:hypothetical protein